MKVAALDTRVNETAQQDSTNGTETRVLIIDDDLKFAEGCRRVLEDAGFAVDVAIDPRNGLARATENHFDVVLLDLKMPYVNGVQILNSLRQKMPDMPVIIITGYADLETTVQTFKMGAVDFLSKPFTPKEIVDAINRAMLRRKEAASPPVSFSDKSPADVAKTVTEKVGPAKMDLPWPKAALLGILAGVYIAVGAALATLVGTDASTYLGLGLSKIAAGLVFSVGLILVVVAGAELFTGNNLMFMTVLARRELFRLMLSKWGTVYTANFVGSVLMAALIFGSGIWKMGDYAVGTQALKIAVAKVNLGFGEALFRGIGCNALVCLAVWMALASQNVTGKILAIVFPITAFVALGFEHCVANMYFIPLGLFLKGTTAASAASLNLTNLTAKGFFIDNLVPVTVGNVIGGAIFVGMVYWLALVRQTREARVTE